MCWLGPIASRSIPTTSLQLYIQHSFFFFCIFSYEHLYCAMRSDSIPLNSHVRHFIQYKMKLKVTENNLITFFLFIWSNSHVHELVAPL